MKYLHNYDFMIYTYVVCRYNNMLSLKYSITSFFIIKFTYL